MARFQVIKFDLEMPQCELDFTNYTGTKRRERCMMVIVQEVFGEAKILQVWVPLFLVQREVNSYYRQHFPDWYYDLLFQNKDSITPEIMERFWHGGFKMSLTTCLNTPYYQVVNKLEKLPLSLTIPDDDDEE